MICQGTGCTNTAIHGASFCSEDHFEELQSERRSRNSARLSTNGTTHPPVAPMKSAIPAAPKPVKAEEVRRSEPAKGKGRPWRAKVDRATVEANAHLPANEMAEKFGIARSTAMRIRREKGTSQPPKGKNAESAARTKAIAVAAVSTGALAVAIDELERQRARLNSQLQAIEAALEALRRVS